MDSRFPFSKDFRSWGNQPACKHGVYRGALAADAIAKVLESTDGPVLAFGNGRSYGDVCLNASHSLIPTNGLNRIIRFDSATGVMLCEAGVTFEQIIRRVAHHGWFPPVVPSTQFITVGGALANDVHGRDHWCRGTFGAHVRAFTLIRSDGRVRACRPHENEELFRATIGGLGLTGFVHQIEFQLKAIRSTDIVASSQSFRTIEECVESLQRTVETEEYVTAWIDCASKAGYGSGFVLAGHHADESLRERSHSVSVPARLASFVPPSFLRPATIAAFNGVWGARPRPPVQRDYRPFLFQLDSVPHWNRLYGKAGLKQFQFVVPQRNAHQSVPELFAALRRNGLPPYFAILKAFGPRTSPGLLSFPMAGITGALDFSAALRPESLFRELTELVLNAGGRLYPAKDLGMSPETFEAGFPQLAKFLPYVDPKFSSNFWRRVRPTHASVSKDYFDSGSDVRHRGGNRETVRPSGGDISSGRT